MSGHELVNQPSVADIIGLYAKLLTLDAQNVSSSLEDPATITNKVMRELMEALEDARRNGTSEDKNALFKYFIEIYLKFTAGTPDELVMVKEKPIALPGHPSHLIWRTNWKYRYVERSYCADYPTIVSTFTSL